MALETELSREEVRRTVFSPANRRRTVWTVTSLLARYGIRANAAKGEEFERIKLVRRRASRSLRELWSEGALYRQEATDNRGGFAEIKYVRPEDASGTYLIFCRRCGEARRSVNHAHGRTLEVCPGCGEGA
ncbi:hypothetical protein OJF2_41430 [Aquisphaera giovannonii]|uniref:Uncharacterized protein n=1 Tax=Aquisphaera giovannonii TaxID=406548 RepID=A0A5B9W6J6_9BACT|nr:hypothetical protein [Aquisphaera giovannonii]QEH35590.1 hypothetical protein OJF2_41430 [Aquisphaera giovannonii]